MHLLLVTLAVLTQAPAVVGSPITYPYSDLSGSHDAWLDPTMIAEVGPSPEGVAALHLLDPNAEAHPASPRVRLWKLSPGVNPGALVERLETKLPGHFAPVLHDDASPSSKLRVPAGGVLVWLAPKTDAAKWAAARGVVVKQELPEGVLLLESPAGVATLKLSVSLAKDPQVKAAMPNWWFKANRR